MSSAMLVERSGISFSSQGIGSQQQPGFARAAGSCVVPRCDIKFEKCTGGYKIHCNCDDDVSAGALQNLCRMLAGGLCSCSCTFNGIPCCQCSLACGNCKCEYTKKGVCISCTSGDKTCAQVIQSCCECLSSCCDAGCCCCISFGNTPVCCSNC